MKTKSGTFFEVTTKMDRVADDGNIKSTTEHSVVEAFTPTDAEARITKFMEPQMAGAFEVISAKKASFNEVEVENNADYWYVAKVELISIDEKTEKEKRKATPLLLSAPNFKAAHDTVMRIMDGSMADWEIVSLVKSKIVNFVEADVK